MSELTPAHITAYLVNNPNFLVQTPDLLAQLELQQKAQGATSLVHIQQRQLREHNTHLKQQIEQLTKHAAQNEVTYRLFSQCHRQLWANNDFKTLARNLRKIICASPAIDECHLVAYSPQFDELITHRLIKTSRYLGRMNQNENALLFKPEVQSSALFLIGDKKSPIAILAFGSHDANHFEPAQDALFALDFVHALHSRLLEFA
jgi:uncharacterized protein YigA (DUF484 family)